MTSSDRFPVPVRSAVKSNLTDWCFQNLSKRALNALTVQASENSLRLWSQRKIKWPNVEKHWLWWVIFCFLWFRRRRSTTAFMARGRRRSSVQTPLSFRRRNAAGQQTEQRVICYAPNWISRRSHRHHVFHLSAVQIQLPVGRRFRIHQVHRDNVQRQIRDARQIRRHCVVLKNASEIVNNNCSFNNYNLFR